MSQLAITSQGLAPGMWAVVSKVISWEWLESSGRVHWVVESILPPHVIKSAIPSIVSIEMVKSKAPRLPGRKPAIRKSAAGTGRFPSPSPRPLESSGVAHGRSNSS